MDEEGKIERILFMKIYECMLKIYDGEME